MSHEKTSRLKRLLVERSLAVGDFTLASGAKSRYYVDARRATMSGLGQLLIGEVGFGTIRAAGWSAQWVGGLTLGADPIAYAIAHWAARSGEAVNAFTVRKERKAHGSGRRIEGGLPRGESVVIIEDTMTTGASALSAVRAVRRHGARVQGLLALVDREEGARESILDCGIPVQSVAVLSELLELREDGADLPPSD